MYKQNMWWTEVWDAREECDSPRKQTRGMKTVKSNALLVGSGRQSRGQAFQTGDLSLLNFYCFEYICGVFKSFMISLSSVATCDQGSHKTLLSKSNLKMSSI